MTDAKRLGACLRLARQQLGWSLADAERNSGGSFTAVVIGSYERGDRNITAVRLIELATLYGMPAAQLIGAGNDDDYRPGRPVVAITLMLDRLRQRATTHGDVADLDRFVRSIIGQRGDFNGTMLSLRRDDLTALAAARGTTTDALMAWLTEIELIRGD